MIKELKLEQLSGGIDYSKDRIQTSPVNQLEEYGWQLMELLQRLNDARQRLLKEKEELERLVEMMPTSIYRQLIRLRYIEGFEWWKIARELNYSEMWVRHRINSEAINELEKTSQKE